MASSTKKYSCSIPREAVQDETFLRKYLQISVAALSTRLRDFNNGAL
jgi:hypothetical protein